jgi:F-type H+-transporting ATPase subunit delta
MKSTKAASRYATALLELAIDNKNIDSVTGDMNYLLSANSETRDFQLLLKSPIIHADKKIQIFHAIFEQFEKVSIEFIELVTRNHREGLLVQIADAFIAKVKEYKGIVPITLISATKLGESAKNVILEKVQATIKGQLEVTEKIDPALIGGFVVRIGDKQIDASVANQLVNLKQRLTR